MPMELFLQLSLASLIEQAMVNKLGQRQLDAANTDGISLMHE